MVEGASIDLGLGPSVSSSRTRRIGTPCSSSCNTRESQVLEGRRRFFVRFVRKFFFVELVFTLLVD